MVSSLHREVLSPDLPIRAPDGPKAKVRKIVAEECALTHGRITPVDVMSKRRFRDVVAVRSICATRARAEGCGSLNNIARIFRVYHTTLLHNICRALRLSKSERIPGFSLPQNIDLSRIKREKLKVYQPRSETRCIITQRQNIS